MWPETYRKLLFSFNSMLHTFSIAMQCQKKISGKERRLLYSTTPDSTHDYQKFKLKCVYSRHHQFICLQFDSSYFNVRWGKQERKIFRKIEITNEHYRPCLTAPTNGSLKIYARQKGVAETCLHSISYCVCILCAPKEVRHDLQIKLNVAMAAVGY